MRGFSVSSGDMHWEEAPSYSPGARICILRHAEDGRIGTMLLKVGSNFRAGGHTNTTGEEQVVVKGEIQSGGRSYDEGSYRYIRHPLYSSLLFLAWGIFFKAPSGLGIFILLAASLALFATARVDEEENIRYFGEEYLEYMRNTKMFIPFLF